MKLRKQKNKTVKAKICAEQAKKEAEQDQRSKP